MSTSPTSALFTGMVFDKMIAHHKGVTDKMQNPILGYRASSKEGNDDVETISKGAGT